MSFSKSKSKQEIDQSTNITNQQATASQGSLAIGAGANANIESVDADVIEAATKGNVDTTRRAFDSLDELADEAFSVSGNVVDRSFGFAESSQQRTSSALEQANDLLARSFQQSTKAIQRSGGVDTSTLASEAQRNQLIIGVAVVGFLAVSLFRGNN